jgi:hypothetical protein
MGRRLWFGFLAAAVAWVTLGCVDILIAWRACQHQFGYGIPESHPGVRVLIGVIALVMLAIAVTGGVFSYRNWRAFASTDSLIETNAVERHEFMAVLGVIVSITLGMGILWLALPPLFLDLCWRAK